MDGDVISGKTLIILELAITAIVCLGFGFYQLWSLKRDKARTRAAREREQQMMEGVTSPAHPDTHPRQHPSE
jgi:hypothetical protein